MTSPVTLKGLEDLVKKYGDAEYDLGVGGAQVRSIRKQEAWEALLSALRAFVEERGEHIALRQTEEAWRRRAEERAEKAERERDAALIAGSDAENRWRVRNDCTIAEALRGATERAAQVVDRRIEEACRMKGRTLDREPRSAYDAEIAALTGIATAIRALRDTERGT